METEEILASVVPAKSLHVIEQFLGYTKVI